MHNTRSRKNSSTEWLTGTPLPRRNVVMGCIGLGLAAGVYRLADYQIVNAGKLRERADARRLLAQTLYAKRGTIYDRNGNVLTSSVECRNIAVNPQLVEDVDKTVSALVKATGIDKKTCRKLVESDGTWVYIKRQVDEDDAAALEKKNLPGVLFEQAMKRVYPYGNLASQVLGVANVDNDGLTGLEKQYNKLLTGTNGSLVRERARDGSYIAGGAYKKVAAVDGVDIVTTLDVNIQRAAEDALAEAVEKTKAKNGSALVTDPTTGEILAACSYPTYDQTDLENAKTEDMNLRLVTDAYEPGSVFKTLVAGTGFDLGVVRSSTSFEVPASIKVGDDTVTDADKRDYAMTMDVREMMRRSSNVGFVLVGRKIGADDFAAYVDKWGIGRSSGVDFPGESLGIVKERDQYDGATLGSMSFGQALSVSPIEIARAVGGIANGGVMMTPHFYKSSKGDEKDWGEGERAISQDAAAQVTSCMQTVVAEGTGVGGAVDGYDVAGKTGVPMRTADILKRTICRPLWGLRRLSRPRCCATSRSTERRAARTLLRCRSSPSWPTRSMYWVSRAQSRGLQSCVWSIVQSEGCSHALHHVCVALGYNTPIALLGLQGSSNDRDRRQQPRGRNRGPNRDGRSRSCLPRVRYRLASGRGGDDLCRLPGRKSRWQ